MSFSLGKFVVRLGTVAKHFEILLNSDRLIRKTMGENNYDMSRCLECFSRNVFNKSTKKILSYWAVGVVELLHVFQGDLAVKLNFGWAYCGRIFFQRGWVAVVY